MFVSEKMAKGPDENRVFVFDFSRFAEIVNGETVTGGTITAVPTGLTIGTVTGSTSQLSARISGGTSGVTYRLTLQATTSGGATLEGWVDMTVGTP